MARPDARVERGTHGVKAPGDAGGAAAAARTPPRVNTVPVFVPSARPVRPVRPCTAHAA